MRIKSLIFGLLCVCATGCQVTSHHETTARPPAKSAEVIVFCNHCGVLAGKSTSCPRWSSHDFQSAPASAKVVCSHCGAKPEANPSSCPHYSAHDFVVFTQ